jgi:fimbrial chaperone protein
VLVSIAPGGGKPSLAVQSSELGKNEAGKSVPIVTVANASNAHGYLSGGNLRLVAKDASGKEVLRRTLSGAEIQQTIGFGLIGGNQSRKVTVPVELPEGSSSVEASFSSDN